MKLGVITEEAKIVTNTLQTMSEMLNQSMDPTSSYSRFLRQNPKYQRFSTNFSQILQGLLGASAQALAADIYFHLRFESAIKALQFFDKMPMKLILSEQKGHDICLFIKANILDLIDLNRAFMAYQGKENIASLETNTMSSILDRVDTVKSQFEPSRKKSQALAPIAHTKSGAPVYLNSFNSFNQSMSSLPSLAELQAAAAAANDSSEQEATLQVETKSMGKNKHFSILN